MIAGALTYCICRSDDVNNQEEDERGSVFLASASADKVFAPQAKLFADGVCSGDVIQGNLGDCWFLSMWTVELCSRSGVAYFVS